MKQTLSHVLFKILFKCLRNIVSLKESIAERNVMSIISYK